VLYICDIGCGDGRWLTAFAKKYQCVCLGLEIEEERLLKAKQALNERDYCMKGVVEFIKAARLFNKYKYNFVIAGPLDYQKSSGFSNFELTKLNFDNSVKFIGYQKNIYDILKKTAIVCLPSYREVLPKSLCEAAACGIPIVTTDTVGCSEVVISGFNGELCKIRNHISLAKKLEKIILNHKLRKTYAKNSINYAKKNFDINIIGDQIVKIYNEL
jgi:glycosyltransferase involved in cell wall biosynthesis